MRSRSPSLESIRATWVLTVASLTTSSAAISAFERPARHQAQHLALALGQLGDRPGGRGAGRRAAHEVLDQAPRERRGEQRVAGGHDAHGVDQLLAADVLQQEAARAGLHRLVDVLVAVEGGEHQHPRGAAAVGHQAPRGLDAVHPGHADVHQHDVGAQLAGEVDRPAAVLGLGRPPRCPPGRRGSSRTRRAPAPGRRRSGPGSSRRAHGLERQARDQGEAALRARPRPQVARRRARRARACRPGRARRRWRRRPRPRPSSRTSSSSSARAVAQDHLARCAGPGVLEGVREALLHDAVRRQVDAGRQRPRRRPRPARSRAAPPGARASTSASRPASPGCGARPASSSAISRRTPEHPAQLGQRVAPGLAAPPRAGGARARGRRRASPRRPRPARP